MEEIWTLKKADEEFSKFIRNRDKRCMHPRCSRRWDTDIKGMQCSHFWRREILTTRFDLENCDSAHAGCHKFKWECDKAGGYRDFKIAQLGRRRFNSLQKRAMDWQNGKDKTTRREAIIKCMKLLKKRKTNNQKT